MTEAKIFSCSQSHDLATSIAKDFGDKLGKIKWIANLEIYFVMELRR